MNLQNDVAILNDGVWMLLLLVYNFLLSGRFPVRTGAWGEQNRIWMPTSKHGLPHYEVTIAEALKEKGYTTGIVGKWHLGNYE